MELHSEDGSVALELKVSPLPVCADADLTAYSASSSAPRGLKRAHRLQSSRQIRGQSANRYRRFRGFRAGTSSRSPVHAMVPRFTWHAPIVYHPLTIRCIAIHADPTTPISPAKQGGCAANMYDSRPMSPVYDIPSQIPNSGNTTTPTRYGRGGISAINGHMK